MTDSSLEHTGGKGRATLDLSTQSLTPKTCAVLGKVLATDRNFTEIKFADCMLSEDGEGFSAFVGGGGGGGGAGRFGEGEGTGACSL